jgi:hypothetical protein
MSGLRRFLRRLRGPLLPFPESGRRSLIICSACGAHVVNPVDWHESGDSAWWVRLRCGACAWTREDVISDEEAHRLERDLAPGLREIAHTVGSLDRERMEREADAFITALAHDLIGPSDFACRLPR